MQEILVNIDVLRLVRKLEEIGSVTDKPDRARKSFHEDELFKEAIVVEINPTIYSNINAKNNDATTGTKLQFEPYNCV